MDIEAIAEWMLENKKVFLPFEESRELFESGVEIKTEVNYFAFIEEVSNGYDYEVDDLLKVLDDVYGIYNEDQTVKLDYAIFKQVGDAEDSFERLLFPAPTYIELLNYIEHDE